MTEAEARERYCPFAAQRSVPYINIIGQLSIQWVKNKNDPESEPVTNCIGSDCMAWRWEGPYDENKQGGKGFCGLAGKP